MKRLSVGLSATLAIVAAAMLGAQTSTTAPKDDRVTVTGCLERLPASNDGAIGSTGTSPGPIYVLITPAGGAVGTAGTSGTTARALKPAYRLQSADLSRLVGYEGAKVEITGTAEGQEESAQAGQEKRPTSGSGAPTLKVISIKTISSDCSR